MQRTPCLSLAFGVAAGLLCGAGMTQGIAAPGGYVPITVSDDAGVERHDEVVRGGVPFARGVLPDIRRLALADDAGDFIPVQARALAGWDDGSVKWALIGFRTDLPADGRRRFRLIVRPEEGDPAENAGVRIDMRDGFVALDTGRLRTAFNTEAFRLFEGVSVRATDGTWRQVCDPADDALYLALLRRESPRIGEHWYAPVGEGGETLPMVSTGPVEFSVEDHGPLSATLRFAGRFHPAGDPEGDMGGKFILRVTAHAGSAELELKHTFIYTGEPTRDFVRAMGIRLSPAFDAERAVFDGGDTETFPLEPGRRIVAVQTSADEGVIDGSRFTARPVGAASIEGASLAVSAFVRDFWRHFPKGMTLSRDSLDIALWPEAAERLLDLRRTVGDDEPNIGSTDREASAQGLAKTHDLLLVFGETGAPTGLRRRASAFNRGLVPSAAPAYMCGTGVEGHVYPADVERFPRTEALGEVGWRWLRAAQERFGWYGMIDYGDFRTNYNRREGVWLETGRYGWRGGAGDIPAGLGLAYLRTGDRDLRDLFIHQVEHIRDVDTVHYAGEAQPHPVGTMHRRNKDHWSGTATAHYTYTRGLGLAYFLTGDPRTREVLVSTANPIADVNMVAAFARSYEATGCPELREGLKRVVQPFIGSPPERPYQSFRFGSDYFRALAQYIRVLPGDAAARDTILEQARWWSHPDRWYRYNYAYGFYELFAFALAHSLDPDRDRFVDFPSYALHGHDYDGPLEGYEDASFDELDQWVRTNASLTVGWYLDFYPYGLAALADAGITEADIFTRREETPFISGPARYATQRGEPEAAGPGGFVFGVLPDPNWPGDRPLRVSDPEGQHRFEPGFERLPWGARLTAGGIPFELAAREVGFSVLSDSPITVPVGLQADRIHLLGLVATRANWRRGDLGAVCRVVFADGEVEDRPLRNLVDYEDVAMWKFSRGTALARYIGYGRPLPRPHVNVLTLETGGRRVESVILLPGEVDDGLCLLAVTVETGEAVSPGGTLYTFGTEAVDGAVHARTAAYDPEAGYGWSARRTGDDAGVDIGRGADFLVDGLAPGYHRVTVAVRTRQARAGGQIDILAGGRRLAGVAIASNADDEISWVTEAANGRLRIGFHPSPGDLGGAWTVGWLRVEPTDEGPRAEAFEDAIADLRPLRTLSTDAEASCEQGWFDGYDFTHPRFAVDGRFDTGFGLPHGPRDVYLVLTFPEPVSADAVRLLVCDQIDGAIEAFGLAVEAERDGTWAPVSSEPKRIESFDFVFRFDPVTSTRFRLHIADRRAVRPRHTPRIREFQLFHTQTSGR